MRAIRHSAPLVLIITCALVGLGCGESETASAPSTEADVAEASVEITAPQDGDAVQGEVEVRGIVAPDGATVDVNGEPAAVEGGRFTAIVTLDEGQDTLQATAASDGGTDTSEIAVVRGPTAAEKRAAAKRKAARARARRRAAAAQVPSTSSGSLTMPDLVGESLQDAQDEMQRVTGNPLFISESEDATGEGRFQVLDRGWQVCGQNVAPGEPFSPDDNIVFAVVKAYEDCP